MREVSKCQAETTVSWGVGKEVKWCFRLKRSSELFEFWRMDFVRASRSNKHTSSRDHVIYNRKLSCIHFNIEFFTLYQTLRSIMFSLSKQRFSLLFNGWLECLEISVKIVLWIIRGRSVSSNYAISSSNYTALWFRPVICLGWEGFSTVAFLSNQAIECFASQSLIVEKISDGLLSLNSELKFQTNVIEGQTCFEVQYSTLKRNGKFPFDAEKYLLENSLEH